MRPLRLTARVASLVLLTGIALAGCGGDDDADPQAGPSPSAASPSAEPSPTPAGPDRSPEALMALLQFSAPTFDDPRVQEAVDGYEEYLRQFLVAQGLSDADYPPLLATIDPSYVEASLVTTVQNQQEGFFLVGPFTETVQEGAGSESQVFLTSCSDYSQRKLYRIDSGEFVRDSATGVIPVTVTMTRGPDAWVVSRYAPNQDLVCP